MTLDEAKLWLRERLNKGEKCPCCNQFAKMYVRKLNSGMAVTLINVFKQQTKTNDWVNINQLQMTTSRDYSYLRFWGLLKEKENDGSREDIKTSGLWQVTDIGIEFITKKNNS